MMTFGRTAEWQQWCHLPKIYLPLETLYFKVGSKFTHLPVSYIICFYKRKLKQGYDRSSSKLAQWEVYFAQSNVIGGVEWAQMSPHLLIWFNSQNGQVITCPVKCGMNLLIHSHTSTVWPFKFENGVISVIISYFSNYNGYNHLPMLGYKLIYVSKWTLGSQRYGITHVMILNALFYLNFLKDLHA